MEIATLDDLHMMEQRIINVIERSLSEMKTENSGKSWVKTNEAMHMMSCSKNTLENFAINNKIKREKKMGRWYYSTKSIQLYLGKIEN